MVIPETQLHEAIKIAGKDLKSRKLLRDYYPVLAEKIRNLPAHEAGARRRLENLLQRIRPFLEPREKRSLVKAVTRFFTQTFPEILRANKASFISANILFWSAVLVSFAAGVASPEFNSAFLSAEVYHHYRSQIETGIKFQNFFVPPESGPVLTAYVMINNLKVALTATAGGLLAGIGTFMILLFNGFMVGSLSAMYYPTAHFTDFITQIFQHGMLELNAIAFSGAAGFSLASAFFTGGNMRRIDILRKKAPHTLAMLLFSAFLLVLAGLIEGLVTPLHLPMPMRLAIIISTGFALWLYIVLSFKKKI